MSFLHCCLVYLLFICFKCCLGYIFALCCLKNLITMVPFTLNVTFIEISWLFTIIYNNVHICRNFSCSSGYWSVSFHLILIFPRLSTGLILPQFWNKSDNVKNINLKALCLILPQVAYRLTLNISPLCALFCALHRQHPEIKFENITYKFKDYHCYILF